MRQSDNLNAAIWDWGIAEGNGVGNYAEKVKSPYNCDIL